MHFNPNIKNRGKHFLIITLIILSIELIIKTFDLHPCLSFDILLNKIDSNLIILLFILESLLNSLIATISIHICCLIYEMIKITKCKLYDNNSYIIMKQYIFILGVYIHSWVLTGIIKNYKLYFPDILYSKIILFIIIYSYFILVIYFLSWISNQLKNNILNFQKRTI